jgi:hypothetical protein
MPVMTTPRLRLFSGVGAQATGTRYPRAPHPFAGAPQLAVPGCGDSAALVQQQPDLVAVNEAIRGPPPRCQLCEPGRSCHPLGGVTGRRICNVPTVALDLGDARCVCWRVGCFGAVRAPRSGNIPLGRPPSPVSTIPVADVPFRCNTESSHPYLDSLPRRGYPSRCRPTAVSGVSSQHAGQQPSPPSAI